MRPGCCRAWPRHRNSWPRQVKVSFVLEGAVQRNGLNRRAHIAGAVDRERVAQAHLHLAEIRGPLEQRPLRLRRGHFGAACLSTAARPGIARDGDG